MILLSVLIIVHKGFMMGVTSLIFARGQEVFCHTCEKNSTQTALERRMQQTEFEDGEKFRRHDEERIFKME